MSENKTYPVFENIARKSHIKKKNYEQMYLRSIEEPDAFWAEQAGTVYKLVCKMGQSAEL